MALPDMVGMVVVDMAAALRFYRLAWDTEALVRSFNPEWRAPTGSRLGLALKCVDSAEVDALYAAVIAAGYRGVKSPWDALWGQRYAIVDDADGNHVDLFAAL